MNPSSILHPLSFGIRVLSFVLVLCQPLVWQFWMTTRSRQSTFFDLRVQPDFPESPAGRGILRTFRRRLWLASAIMATMYAVVSSRQPLELSTLWLFAAMLATMPCRWIALLSARRATRASAPIVPEPSIRTAALFDENDRAAPWLTLLEWTGILLPLALPLATAVYIALNHGPRRSLVQPLFLCALGLFPAAGQFALRFGARSSDWAPNAHSSRKYRALLGFMQAALFSYIILQGCVLLVMGLHPRPPMFLYFSFVFPGWALVYIFLFKTRSWLKNHFAPESSDPMPDDCWKRGFYFNRNDPALVVPLRSGIGYSPNGAHASVWIVAGAATAIAAVSLVQSVTGIIELSHRFNP